MTFEQGLKSFIGYLEGTGKAAHTIKSYRLDLLAFRDFARPGRSQGRTKNVPFDLDALDFEELTRFQEHLRSLGLKTNSRRRMVLTVRRFLCYLVKRRKLPEDMGRKVPVPHKVERIPLTVPPQELVASIARLAAPTAFDLRNRALLWTLAESGCRVSEIARVRFEDWSQNRPMLSISGKFAREIPVSPELVAEIRRLEASGGQGEWVFPGFNRFGSLGGAISSRGVELLVRRLATALGDPRMTPRTFRHSAVIRWHLEGCSREEIQRRLGLKTAYAFRAYEPLMKSAVSR